MDSTRGMVSLLKLEQFQDLENSKQIMKYAVQWDREHPMIMMRVGLHCMASEHSIQNLHPAQRNR
jgi:hypothetical protein